MQTVFNAISTLFKTKLNVFKNIFFVIFLKIWNVLSFVHNPVHFSALCVYIMRNVILMICVNFRKYLLRFEYIMLFFQICINFQFPARFWALFLSGHVWKWIKITLNNRKGSPLMVMTNRPNPASQNHISEGLSTQRKCKNYLEKWYFCIF